MILKTLVMAQPALQKLILQDLPLRKALELMRLVEEANKFLTFFSVEMAKAGLDRDRIEKLEQFEVDGLGVQLPVKLPMNDNLRLSAADCKLLEGFIVWEEAEA